MGRRHPARLIAARRVFGRVAGLLRAIPLVAIVLITTACTARVTGYTSPIAHDYGSVEWYSLRQTVVQPFVAGPGTQAAIANDGKTTPEQFQERLARLPYDARNGTIEEIAVGLRLAGVDEARDTGVWRTGARIQLIDDSGTEMLFDTSVDSLPRDGGWLTIGRPPSLTSGQVVNLRIVPGNGRDAERLQYGITPDRVPYGGWIASNADGGGAGGALLLRTTYERDVALRPVLTGAFRALRAAPRDDLRFSVVWALSLAGLLAGAGWIWNSRPARKG